MAELKEVEDMLETGIPNWTEQAIQEGLQRGRREGEGRFLRTLAEQKFGTLEEAVLSRIAAADEERLLRWGTRLLSAERIEDVFDD